ncbi:hypothetical protein SIID45300_01817 [Candidatus Magnetaquicoccaceae bacterium FCR-1]|uniref:Transposase InsH N-terminal domain-containing protein n=1 Tax=Candidatus Magnetaquiglobus chichijimensis TaxID=3141448 RepID=A0ABQ0C9D2_9PROT
MAAHFPHEGAENAPGEPFAGLYHASVGCPNTPVAILVSLSVLKEMFDLTDEALMGSFRFDLRFHYALGLSMEETGVTLRTLENFRARAMKSEAVGATFQEVTDRIIEALGLNTGQQRHDSTHFRFNMTNLTRLGLFVRTLEHFLGGLPRCFRRGLRRCRRKSANVTGSDPDDLPTPNPAREDGVWRRRQRT